MASPSGRTAEYCAGEPGARRMMPNSTSSRQAVFDVQAQSPERGHQRLDFERLAGTCTQESEQARAERRLNEGTESCLDVAGRIGPRP
jgi:hypothetical protein